MNNLERRLCSGRHARRHFSVQAAAAQRTPEFKRRLNGRYFSSAILVACHATTCHFPLRRRKVAVLR